MKKFVKIAFVAAFAAIAGYGVYANQKADTMSDLMLANVEALAGGESSGCHYINGYKAFTSNSGRAYDCCMVAVPNAPDKKAGNCQ